MRRFHLMEFHEQPWYPDSWRQLTQHTLGWCGGAMKPLDIFSDHFRSFLERIRPRKVLDLCSGSGQFTATFWRGALDGLELESRPQLVLSDLYPNLERYRQLERAHPDISHHAEPIDALEPPEDGGDVWMMIESLHHFRPSEVRQILQKATENADGFAAFEITQRRLKNILTVVPMMALTTPLTIAFLVRPFSFKNVLWGLLVPIVPLTLIWDAVASNLRSYTLEELEEMTRSIDAPNFQWEMRSLPVPRTNGLMATYLFGWRRD